MLSQQVIIELNQVFQNWFSAQPSLHQLPATEIMRCLVNMLNWNDAEMQKCFCKSWFCMQKKRVKGKVLRHLSATSYVFHPNMLHPLFYTLSISSLMLHFSHFLPCLFIPWISSYTISNSISQNTISSLPFYPH